jgi:hypothetical protein
MTEQKYKKFLHELTTDRISKATWLIAAMITTTLCHQGRDLNQAGLHRTHKKNCQKILVGKSYEKEYVRDTEKKSREYGNVWSVLCTKRGVKQ